MCSGLHIKVFPVKTLLTTLEKHCLTQSLLAALAVGEPEKLVKLHAISTRPPWCYSLSCVYHVSRTVSGSLHSYLILTRTFVKWVVSLSTFYRQIKAERGEISGPRARG